MITVNDIAVEFGGTTLFSEVTFAINETDKIALMGKNGAGKSTLLKIVAGVNKPTRGVISAPSDAVIAYLPQHLLTEDNCTVMEETSKAFASVLNMKKEIDEINEQLTVRTDYESDEYMKLIEKVSELSEKYYSIEEVNYEAEVEKILKGLGFEREDFNRPTKEFSGGWRMRIELAKILLTKPDLILLDEPTNHLDMDSIEWLEEFLITQAKAVMVISHDRAFVDNITNRTIEVTMGRIYDYKAKYSHYLELRKDRRVHQQKAYEEQQKFIADNQAFIERFRGTFSKTEQVQSRVRMLEKLVLVEVDEVDTSALKKERNQLSWLLSSPVESEFFYNSFIDILLDKIHDLQKDITLNPLRASYALLQSKEYFARIRNRVYEALMFREFNNKNFAFFAQYKGAFELGLKDFKKYANNSVLESFELNYKSGSSTETLQIIADLFENKSISNLYISTDSWWLNATNFINLLHQNQINIHSNIQQNFAIEMNKKQKELHQLYINTGLLIIFLILLWWLIIYQINKRINLLKNKANKLSLGDTSGEIHFTQKDSISDLAISLNKLSQSAENFAKLAGQNKIVMLGAMMELGEHAAAEHLALLELIASNTFTHVVLVGDDFLAHQNAVPQFIYFKTTSEAKAWLLQKNPTHAQLLIKGSRSMQMESVLA